MKSNINKNKYQFIMSKGPKVPQTLKISRITDSPGLPMTQPSSAMNKLGLAMEEKPHMAPSQQYDCWFKYVMPFPIPNSLSLKRNLG